MSKILKDTELLEIVSGTIEGDLLDDRDTYREFCLRLGEVIAEFFGGEATQASEIRGDGLGVCVHFDPNDSLPSDGGVFAAYDTGVTWKDGTE